MTFSDAVLDSDEYSSSGLQEMLEEVVDRTNKMQIPASLYVERFWKNSRILEGDAIDFGFVVIEQMHVLTKKVLSASPEGNSRIESAVTKDVQLWNKAFVKSFGIPDTWAPELLRRLNQAVADPTTLLIVAREEGVGEASGCTLLRINPPECLGIYCVGTIPERRSHGVARAMMAEAEREAFERNCRILVLQTLASDGVTPMYLKMGFETTFERDVMQFR